MATISIILKHKRKDGLYSLMLRIFTPHPIPKERRAYIKIDNCRMPKENWDPKTQKVIKGFNGRGKQEWNGILQREKNKLEEVCWEAGRLPAKQIKEIYLGQGQEYSSMTDFVLGKVNENGEREGGIIDTMNKASSKKQYLSTFSSFQKYLGEEIYFSDLNKSVVIGYDNFLRDRGSKPNGRATYLTQISRLVNLANEKEVTSISNPFSKYKLPKEQTTDPYLTIEELKHLMSIDIKGKRLNISREVFLLQTLLCGASFADLKKMDKTKKYFTYRREKWTDRATNKPVKVLIVPKAKELIEKINIKEIIYNYYYYDLKQIEKKYKLTFENSSKLTAHVARYTWANLARSQGYATDFISEMIGHKYGSAVTQGYLASFSQEKKDECALHIASLI